MTSWQTGFAILRITDPLVAWLVYRGEMVSASHTHEQAVSFWMARYLASERSVQSRGSRFQNELHLETLRQTQYADKVSRLSGFYVFEDTASAQRAIEKWQGSFRPDLVAEVALRPGCTVSRHDGEWITHHLGRNESSDWMHAYLQGEGAGEEPIWELVVSGRGLVLGKSLREAAYDVVKAAWPKSLPLLELARVGVELDSDLGLIVGMLTGQEVQYCVNFADATDADFLARFAAFDGPKNTNDLGPDSDLVLPDLTGRRFQLPA